VMFSLAATGFCVTGQLNNVPPPLLEYFLRIHDVRRAPKSASKRVFLITDEDNPHSGPGSKQLVTSARTTLIVSDIFYNIENKQNKPKISIGPNSSRCNG